MVVNLKKLTYSNLYFEKPKYFKQFNIYETIDCKDYYLNKTILIKNRYYKVKQMLKIAKVDSTIPTLTVKSTKIIDTLEGTSLEGQHLSGKKLIIVGEISLRLVVSYYYCNNIIKYAIKNIKIPFSIFIIIPKEICNIDAVNLNYLIEDISIADLGENRILVSVTPLIQYVDEYINNKVC